MRELRDYYGVLVIEDKHDVLVEVFGYPSFRLLQEQAIDSIMGGSNTLLIMPTGGGKSLCYQIPAILLEGLTVVISPLLSLMKDQVDALKLRGVYAETLNSMTTDAERVRILRALGRGDINLLYVSPESLRGSVGELLVEVGVDMVAVDEAHCISQWGHSFRPEYGMLPTFLERMGSPRVIALTATATPEVANDIAAMLDIGPDNYFRSGVYREGFKLSVEEATNRDFKIPTLLKKEGALPAIVYCRTVKDVKKITSYIKRKGLKVAAYTGQMPKAKRNQTQQDFLDDEIEVVVATNAFGMGVDKPNVRTVIHYQIPGTLEAYYQEVGRAGRDGKPCQGVVYYSDQDSGLLKFFITKAYPAPAKITKVLEYLRKNLTVGDPFGDTADVDPERLSASLGFGSKGHFEVTSCINILVREGVIESGRSWGSDSIPVSPGKRFKDYKVDAAEHSRKKNLEYRKLDAMIAYCDPRVCRTSALQEYFGEAPGEPCGQCDTCCNR